ncbi:MAG: VOC family protein [Pseudorhodobacter sp.]
MSQPNPMQGVVPYLAMAGRAAEACDFYARAFGAEEAGRMPMPEGQPGLMHAQIFINGGALMMTDHGMNPGGSDHRAIQTDFGHLQLVVADGRFWWDRAVAAGCTVLQPYERQFWGDDWGLVQDPFGLKWGILQTGAVAA